MTRKRKTSEPLEFFQTLWPRGLPPGGNLVVVVKHDNVMAPEFHTDLEKAAQSSISHSAKWDVYYGVAAQPAVPSGRGTANTAMAIPAFWIDVDFSKGFPDLDAVDRFLEALPLPPSLQVVTGGGVHPYWLLDGWLAAGDDAAALELGWLQHCRRVAKDIADAELDAVADLARVMRVPGTRNYKRQPTVPVTVRSLSGEPRRYAAGDFAGWRDVVRPARRSAALAATGPHAGAEFTLREGAQPPMVKWMAVVANFTDVDDIFMHRKKMPVDNSISGYDLSLATRLDQLNWTPQEIVDTVIAHRTHWAATVTDDRTAKDPLHLNDPSYYERLLRKARISNERDRVSAQAAVLAEEVVDELRVAAATETPSDVDPNLRKKWLTAVSQVVGVVFEDLWAVDSIESPWNIRMQVNGETRDITIGGPEKLLSWQTWKRIIMLSGASVESIPKKEPPQLHSLVCRAGMFVRITGKGQGTTQRDAFISYLIEVLDSAEMYDESSALERQPFRKSDSGSLGMEEWGEAAECLFVTASMMHFDVKTGKCPPMPNVRAALVGLGFVYRTVAVRSERGDTSRSYYCLPVSRLRALSTLSSYARQTITSISTKSNAIEGRGRTN